MDLALLKTPAASYPDNDPAQALARHKEWKKVARFALRYHPDNCRLIRQMALTVANENGAEAVFARQFLAKTARR